MEVIPDRTIAVADLPSLGNASASVYEQIYIYLLTRSDPRLKSWPLMGGPEPIAAILAIYALIVWLGPKYMEDKKPFSLRYVILPYNFGLTLLSIYMTYELFISAVLANYTLKCQLVDYSYNPLAMRMARVCWWYFFSKVIELFDTVFFILRKKNNQLTFLHVYHHGAVIINWYLGAKYIAGGQAFFIALSNSFVHIWMYLYYFLAAIGPQMQPYLTWKRYLTKLQLVQFFLMITHLTYNTILSDCEFPRGFCYLALLFCITMVILFGNYYYHEYRIRAVAKLKKHS